MNAELVARLRYKSKVFRACGDEDHATLFGEAADALEAESGRLDKAERLLRAGGRIYGYADGACGEVIVPPLNQWPPIGTGEDSRAPTLREALDAWEAP